MLKSQSQNEAPALAGDEITPIHPSALAVLIMSEIRTQPSIADHALGVSLLLGSNSNATLHLGPRARRQFAIEFSTSDPSSSSRDGQTGSHGN